MQKIICCAIFALAAQVVFAQPSRDITKEEADYINRVNHVLVKALPTEFKGWIVDFRPFEDEIAGQSRTSNCGYGRDCFWNFMFRVVYDGTTVPEDRQVFQDSMKLTPFDWHMSAMMGRYINNHQLIVSVSTNETLFIGDFRYCGPKGYKTLPPPAGFDHYYFASTSACFPHDAQDGQPDVNIFTIGAPPAISDQGHPDMNKGQVLFSLNDKLPNIYKVQNIVVRIIGSKALAKDILGKMDIQSLRKLTQ